MKLAGVLCPILLLVLVCGCEPTHDYGADFLSDDDEKYLVISTYGGLGNRLHALASAALVAEQTHRTLVLDWPLTAGQMPAEFGQLFQNPIKMLSDIRLKNGVPLRELLDKCHRQCHDVAKWVDPRDETSPAAQKTVMEMGHLHERKENILYVRTLFNFRQSNTSFAEYLDGVRRFYQALKPVAAIQERLDNFITEHRLNDGPLVGVHIRSWHLTKDYAGCEIRAGAFIDKMKEIVDQDPQVRFFVAADNRAMVSEIERVFANKTVQFDFSQAERTTLSGTQNAILEWLMLGKTDYLLGTYQSSFSDEAALLTKQRRKLDVGPANYRWFHSVLGFSEMGVARDVLDGFDWQHKIEAQVDGSAPIDVVIPAAQKDFVVLPTSVRAARDNVVGVRDIYVVSKADPQIEGTIWVPEDAYPFSPMDLKKRINEKVCDFGHKCDAATRLGWHYQQLLKLYVFEVLPHISSHVLVLDADTVLLKPTRFVGEDNTLLFATGDEYHRPYFEHAGRILPGFKRVFGQKSGIVHHALLEKSLVNNLLEDVRHLHGKAFWKVFVDEIDSKDIAVAAASEYEIYFNYVFIKTNQAKIRDLNWRNVAVLDPDAQAREGLDFVAWHDYLR